jgi:hypothetical protein
VSMGTGVGVGTPLIPTDGREGGSLDLVATENGGGGGGSQKGTGGTGGMGRGELHERVSVHGGAGNNDSGVNLLASGSVMMGTPTIGSM